MNDGACIGAFTDEVLLSGMSTHTRETFHGFNISLLSLSPSLSQKMRRIAIPFQSQKGIRNGDYMGNLSIGEEKKRKRRGMGEEGRIRENGSHCFESCVSIKRRL